MSECASIERLESELAKKIWPDERNIMTKKWEGNCEGMIDYNRQTRGL